ncbi:hypothetical protein ACFE04_001349 [Oxalis oulophora]
MVYSSLPAYLDPSNWQQQPINHGGSSSGANTQLPPPPPPPPPPPLQSGGGGSIRPGSMSDRARLANVPMPEAALKCPRCESTNTKFCYFNNYSLSQPRHFCKTCRRYWTRGGALRSVPVGGGCRRNKRSSSKAKSDNLSGSDRQATSSSSTINNSSMNSGSSEILGLGSQIPPLRFMNSNFHQLTDFGATGDHQIGLNYGGINPHHDLTFNIGNALPGHGGGGLGSSLFGMSGLDQWRLHPPPQFSFLGGGMENSSSNLGLYPFDSGVEPSGYNGSAQFRPKMLNTSTSEAITTATTQLALVKMEDNNHHRQELNLSRQCLGINNINDHQYNWSSTTPPPGGSTPWTDLSSFSSSSTSNPAL